MKYITNLKKTLKQSLEVREKINNRTLILNPKLVLINNKNITKLEKEIKRLEK